MIEVISIVAILIVSISALIISILAYRKAHQRSNLFVVRQGKDIIIKDNKGEEILTITKI